MVKLNERAYDHARKLIKDGEVVLDERDDWSEHQPSAQQENDFIKEHGWGEYARWYLGIDEDEAEETKGTASSPTVTSRRCIVAGSSRPRCAPGRTSTSTSSGLPPTCMERWTS